MSAPVLDAPGLDVPVLDVRAFRSALGAFTTGVTIITTRSPDGGTWV